MPKKHPLFFKNLEAFLKTQGINPDQVSTALIEDPDMQDLIAIWLEKKNVLQLRHLLIDMSKEIDSLSVEKQTIALEAFAKHARLLTRLMPQITDYDLAVKKAPEQVDGWFDLNRPLFELSDTDMKKLQKFALYINAGFFSANTVLEMNPRVTAAFENRVAQIIEEYPSYLLPKKHDKTLVSMIYPDELLKYLKKDRITQEILNGIQHVQPIDAATGTDLKTTEATTHTSNATTEPLLEPEEKNTPLPPPTTKKYPVGRLREMNIEQLPPLQYFIDKGMLDPKDVPDRLLAIDELDRCFNYYEELIKQAHTPPSGVSLETLLGLDNNNSELDQTRPSKIIHAPSERAAAKEQPIRKIKPSSTPTSVTEAKKPIEKKTQKKDGKTPFIPVIKDVTHNVEYQSRNEETIRRNKEKMTKYYKEQIPREDIDPDNKGSKPK